MLTLPSYLAPSTLLASSFSIFFTDDTYGFHRLHCPQRFAPQRYRQRTAEYGTTGETIGLITNQIDWMKQSQEQHRVAPQNLLHPRCLRLTYFTLSISTLSRAGFNCTLSNKSQLRLSPLQRSGFLALAL